MGRRLKNDVIFLTALVAVICVFAVLYLATRGEGDRVTVTVDGEIVGEYALSEDREITIGEGDRINVLVIKDGKAMVTRATCPDGICASHRAIHKDGESIVCLPHKTVIAVKSAEKAPDIVA